MIWDELSFFKKSEFDCRCGCGRNEMNLAFLEKLDELRARVGFPLIVSSGYRCPEHNQAVSSTGPSGPHTTGHAVDFAISGREAYDLVHVAARIWVASGIGLKQHGPHESRFIHLDDLPSHPRPNVWTYP